MADSKITALTAISTVDPTADPLVIVDVSDTSMAASGTTKKSTINQLLGAGGTATLASATITGDLTVDTSTLKVDSANNRVGINKASPAYALDVVGNATISATAGNNNWFYIAGNGNTVGSTSFDIGQSSSNEGYVFNRANGPIIFGVNNTTAMTLNATGLGVGVTPAAGDGSGAFKAAGTGSLTANSRVGLDVRELVSGNQAGIILGAMTTENTAVIGSRTGSGNIAFQTYYAGSWGERMRIANDGNVGIGVTPSAWDTNYKALQLGYPNFISGNNGGNIIDIGVNAYFNTDWKYAASSVAATRYRQVVGVHQWFTAPSGTAGNVISWTQAMTLDASGNLGIGVAANPNTRVQVKGSSSGADYCVYSQNSSSTFLFGVRNDGLFVVPSDATLTQAPYNLTTGSAANLIIDSSGILYRSTSSLKYKSDIADSTRGLADVLKLRPVTYKAKNSGDTVFGGLIAEEVDAAGLTEFVQYAPDKTPDAIHYGNMVSLLVAAIKELTARVQTLETR